MWDASGGETRSRLDFRFPDGVNPESCYCILASNLVASSDLRAESVLYSVWATAPALALQDGNELVHRAARRHDIERCCAVMLSLLPQSKECE